MFKGVPFIERCVANVWRNVCHPIFRTAARRHTSARATLTFLWVKGCPLSSKKNVALTLPASAQHLAQVNVERNMPLTVALR